MKKILFMVSSMNIGGVEKSLLSLLATIPKNKYEITLLVLEKKGGLLEFVPDWVIVEDARWFNKVKPMMMESPHDIVGKFFRAKQYIKMLFYIWTYLISKHFNNRYSYYQHVLKYVPKNPKKYDIAISYQGPTDIIDFYILNKINAAKKITWVHFDISKHIINKKLYKKLYRSFNKIFVVSNNAKNSLIELFPSVESKTEVFLNIVPHLLIHEMSKQPTPFDDDFKGIKIVTVGRLSQEKGQDIAIKVLSRLRKSGYEVRWYCIGEGKQRKEFEALIENNHLKNDFILMGATPNPYPYILKADIYVQTSRHEGYCLTLAEAKSLGKPIITTNFIGAYEQIKDGETGYIVECSEEELYKTIKYLLDNSRVQKKLIKNLLNYTGKTTIKINKLLTYIN